jgi:hypothetical protein
MRRDDGQKRFGRALRELLLKDVGDRVGDDADDDREDGKRSDCLLLHQRLSSHQSLRLTSLVSPAGYNWFSARTAYVVGRFPVLVLLRADRRYAQTGSPGAAFARVSHRHAFGTRAATIIPMLFEGRRPSDSDTLSRCRSLARRRQAVYEIASRLTTLSSRPRPVGFRAAAADEEASLALNAAGLPPRSASGTSAKRTGRAHHCAHQP